MRAAAFIFIFHNGAASVFNFFYSQLLLMSGIVVSLSLEFSTPVYLDFALLLRVAAAAAALVLFNILFQLFCVCCSKTASSFFLFALSMHTPTRVGLMRQCQYVYMFHSLNTSSSDNVQRTCFHF